MDVEESADPPAPDPEDEDAPDAVAAAPLLGITAALTAFMAWAGFTLVAPALAGDDPTTRAAATLFLALWALLTGVVAYGLTSPLRTDVDERGVSRATLRGRVEIPWREVEDVRASGRASIVVSDGSKSIRLQAWAYRDRDGLVGWMEERVRRAKEGRARPRD